jgi:hypothetical protein
MPSLRRAVVITDERKEPGSSMNKKFAADGMTLIPWIFVSCTAIRLRSFST